MMELALPSSGSPASFLEWPPRGWRLERRAHHDANGKAVQFGVDGLVFCAFLLASFIRAKSGPFDLRKMRKPPKKAADILSHETARLTFQPNLVCRTVKVKSMKIDVHYRKSIDGTRGSRSSAKSSGIFLNSSLPPYQRTPIAAAARIASIMKN